MRFVEVPWLPQLMTRRTLGPHPILYFTSGILGLTLPLLRTLFFFSIFFYFTYSHNNNLYFPFIHSVLHLNLHQLKASFCIVNIRIFSSFTHCAHSSTPSSPYRSCSITSSSLLALCHFAVMISLILLRPISLIECYVVWGDAPFCLGQS